MTWNKRVVTLVLIFLVSSAILFWSLRTREPVYNGKSLTGWLAVAYYDDGPEHDQAETAIRKIGTNALPVLLKMAISSDSAFRARCLGMLPDGLRYRLGLRNDVENYYLSCEGLHVLGTNAKSTVPVLTSLLNHKDPDVRCRASQVLSSIGPSAEDAIPTLIEHFNDTNIMMQYCVRTALGSIHAHPELVVPLLLKNLDESNRIQGNHLSAMLALTNFQAQSREIVPEVSRLEYDRDPVTRACATNVLKAFAGESTGK